VWVDLSCNIAIVKELGDIMNSYYKGLRFKVISGVKLMMSEFNATNYQADC